MTSSSAASWAACRRCTAACTTKVVDREIFTLCKNEKYGQLIENLENVEDSASQMADFALSGQTVAQQITMLAGLTAEDADAALQHILCTDRMATMYIQPDGTAPQAGEDEEDDE